MKGIKIVERARKAKQDFGDGYPKKFGGASVIEILRDELGKIGIATSQRDVYVRGIPLEIDLIIPRKTAKPWLKLLYEPNEVAFALEVKKTGSFAEVGRNKIKDDFTCLKRAGIRCIYISFEERENYKWRPKKTARKFNYPCFNLAWHKKSNGPLEPTGDWEKFVSSLQEGVQVN